MAGPEHLPDGITSATLTQYWVGNYTYTDLKHALAEHQRQTASQLEDEAPQER